MFNLLHSKWHSGKFSVQGTLAKYPAECCGAYWSSNPKTHTIREYFDDETDAFVSNKGIHIWPTKVVPDAAFGECWDVSLGGEELTVSIILDPEIPREGTVVPYPYIKDEETTQTIYSVYFSSLLEYIADKLPSFSDQQYFNYFGCTRDQQRAAFKDTLALINKNTHLLFILTDDQISHFDTAMLKHGQNVKQIRYPHKIVNRNYHPEDNPRLTLLFLTHA
jgi:hypothetical protein